MAIAIGNNKIKTSAKEDKNFFSIYLSNIFNLKLQIMNYSN